MNKDCVEMGINEYDFIKLFLATNVVLKNNSEFDSLDLQGELYKYSSDSKYRFLFQNMDVDDSERKVYIDEAMGYAKAFGLICKDKENIDDTQFIIILDQDEAKKIFKKYGKREIEAMDKLCDVISLSKQAKKEKVKN